MKVGDKAPDFTLKDSEGRNWTLSEQRGKIVVLLFYPGDNTPVCTKQMCSVRDNWEAYQTSGVEAVGISTDSVESHKGFSEKYNLPLTLLADEEGEVVEKYGVKSWLPGRSARAVVIIDKEGVIRHYQVQPLSVFRPKDEEVLEAIRRAEVI
jgi:thioredoxin-dependent peroxiredoxin